MFGLMLPSGKVVLNTQYVDVRDIVDFIDILGLFSVR